MVTAIIPAREVQVGDRLQSPHGGAGVVTRVRRALGSPRLLLTLDGGRTTCIVDPDLPVEVTLEGDETAEAMREP